jgi:hypothetical protein
MAAAPGSPLIVIGMHRSGTSLVTQILARAGVFLGSDRNSHDESYFFRGLNDLVFRAAHAEWDWPLALAPLYADETTCNALMAELEARVRSREARPSSPAAWLARAHARGPLRAVGLEGPPQHLRCRSGCRSFGCAW